jgi:2-desacetyl-2-hydroxyethyl bacteriochlorophyllide A dehydrogenase
MKAMILKAHNQEMSLEEVGEPIPDSHEIILRVKACGVCGTDLKIVSGMLPSSVISLPHILGHEIAGEVVKIGSAVKDITPGQTGLVYFYVTCRNCEMCRTGKENLCLSIKRLGFELPGGFAQFIKLPAYNFCPHDRSVLPNHMAVLPDAVATSYHALKTMAGVSIGQTVLIVGIGGLGIHAVQIAKLMGLKTIAADRRMEPLKLAEKFRSDFLIDTSKQNPVEAIMEITKGRGVDAVIENVGSKETLGWSLYCLKRRGRLVLVGYVPSESSCLPTMDMHYNEWNICGSRVSTKQELLEVIDLVEEGKIQPVISKEFFFEEANEALEFLKQRKAIGRTILTFKC